MLILCRRQGRYVAGALNFIGGDTLFGRNWGCTEHHPFLHFEACYYQAIDFAIDRGLKKVEAGAQGGHKVARGYLPEATYSAHWISDPSFRDAVKRFLEDERRYVAEDIDYTERRSPFKSTVDLGDIRGGPGAVGPGLTPALEPGAQGAQIGLQPLDVVRPHSQHLLLHVGQSFQGRVGVLEQHFRLHQLQLAPENRHGQHLIHRFQDGVVCRHLSAELRQRFTEQRRRIPEQLGHVLRRQGFQHVQIAVVAG